MYMQEIRGEIKLSTFNPESSGIGRRPPASLERAIDCPLSIERAIESRIERCELSYVGWPNRVRSWSRDTTVLLLCPPPPSLSAPRGWYPTRLAREFPAYAADGDSLREEEEFRASSSSSSSLPPSSS